MSSSSRYLGLRRWDPRQEVAEGARLDIGTAADAEQLMIAGAREKRLRGRIHGVMPQFRIRLTTHGCLT